MFVGEHLAGPGIAALDLVEDQHQIMLVGERAQAGHEGLAGRADAALPLHRLDEEAGSVGPDRRLDRVEIVERNDGEAGQ